MPLSPEETKALTILVSQGVESGLREFREEVNKRFDDVTTSIDGLSKKVEKVEQEQLAMGTQLGRVESRLDGVEARLDGVESRLAGVDSRLDGVESRLGRVEVDVRVIRDAVERHDDELDDLKTKRA